MKSSDVLRLERYLKFHLKEILEELGSSDEAYVDAESRWSSKWGPSVDMVKEYQLRSLEDISSALSRMREGTYGDCVGCGNEIDVRRLEVVPWAKFCVLCQEESDQQRQCG
jgi:RNA polymerase-binding transcription factor DksA